MRKLLLAALLALFLAQLPLAASVCSSKSPLSDAERQYGISYSYDCRENLLIVKVLDSSGAPLNGVRVGLIDQNPPLANNSYTNTNADGLAGFSLEKGGNYFIFAYAYGACPGDGRFLPSMELCDPGGNPILQNPRNESNSAKNETPPGNLSDWISPRSLVRNFTIINRPVPQSLPKPGTPQEALSAEASLALSEAQRDISSALSASFGRQDGNITSALSLLALAQNAFANEDYTGSRALAAQASSILSAGRVKSGGNSSSQQPMAAQKGGLSIADAATEGMLLNALAILGAVLVLWGVYYLIPKGPLD